MAQAAEDEPMPAQGWFVNRPHHPAKQIAMNEEEIKKELEQIPKEWSRSFTIRIAAQSLAPALLMVEEAIKREKVNHGGYLEDKKIEFLCLPLCAYNYRIFIF